MNPQGQPGGPPLGQQLIGGGGGQINPADILQPSPQQGPTDSSWRTPEKRQLVIKKIAETVKVYPDVLTRNPADVETSIFQRARSEHEYMNMVGKIVLSIKQKGIMQQQQHHQQWAPPPPHGMAQGGGEWVQGRPAGPVMQPGYPSYATPHGPYIQPGHRMIYNNTMPPHMGGPPQPGIHPAHMMNTVHRPPYAMIRQAPPPPHRATVPTPPMHPGGECVVSAVPNPSFPTTNEQRNIPSYNNTNSGPPTGGPSNNSNNTQTQANSPKPLQSAPSPRGVTHPIPSPNTPWNPNSPSAAHSPSNNTTGSTNNNTVTPETNTAVLHKLQELQPYIPLLARMIDKLARGGGEKDKARSDQLTKLTSLYNVLHSKNMKVSLPTLEKCHVALKRIFEKDQPTTAPSSVPATSVEATPPPPRPPVPPTPPISSMSLQDFKIIHSPPPLISYLQPVMSHCNDPLERLSPSKKMKLNQQASKSFIHGIKRELNDLTHFDIKQVSNNNDTECLDGSITIQCTFIDDSFPAIPPLLITVPTDYPDTSPHCTISESTASNDIIQSVYELLMNKLTSTNNGVYTISHILNTYEASLIQVIAKQLRQDTVNGL